MGSGKHCEIERKYLIRYPDLRILEEKTGCQKVDIVQTYLLSRDDKVVRVRKRVQDGNATYYRTEKRY